MTQNQPTIAARPRTSAGWISLLAALFASWIAADSAGLLEGTLRVILVWSLLLLAFVFAPRTGRIGLRPRLLRWATVVIGCALTAAGPVPVRVAGIAVFLLGLAGDDRRLIAGARAIAIFAVYRLALVGFPLLWHSADAVGGQLGASAQLLGGFPLSVGATFGGVDFLVVSLAFWLASWNQLSKLMRLMVPLFLGGAHLAYLLVLSCVPGVIKTIDAEILRLQQLAGGATEVAAGRWFLGWFEWLPLDSLQAAWKSTSELLPWNVPALALLLHGAIAVWAFSRSRTLAVSPDAAQLGVVSKPQATPRPRWQWLPVVCALLLSASTTLTWQPATLEGKRVIAFEKVYGNWLRPTFGDYGRLSIGMYGMMEQYVRNLGGDFAVTETLDAEHLADADVLIVIYPHEPWEEGQLERMENYVRGGGTLLIFGEHSTREDDGGVRFNDVLRPTGIQVAFDSSTFAIGGWLHSYEPSHHPATIGIDGRRNDFGVVIGASLDLPWTARPMIVGRWGFNDPGDVTTGPAKMGNDRYDPGERLGDVMLAAEASLGEGTVVAFGDTSTVTNGITMTSHNFSSRLLGYLAGRPDNPHSSWRQWVGALLLLVVLNGLFRLPGRSLFWVLALLGVGVTASAAYSESTSEIMADGRGAEINRLAYMDASHLNRYSAESWRDEGTMGFRMMLLRQRYLCLELRELTRERLSRAGLFATIAPRRPYTEDEVDLLQEFVTNGGILLCGVGYEDRAGSQAILDRFGFRVGHVDRWPSREPQPMGHFKSPYLRTEKKTVYVRFDEAWPVSCVAADGLPINWADTGTLTTQTARRMAGWLMSQAMSDAFSVDPTQPARVITYAMGNHPAILVRRVGRGAVAVLADTGFMHDRNTERKDGLAMDELRENADFWRWFLTDLEGRETWLPPALEMEKVEKR